VSLFEVLFELLVFFVITFVASVFVMSEMALVSSRRSRLLFLANSGDRRARAVLDLLKSPTRFLSTIQMGITVAGLLAGAFSGARLAKALAAFLEVNVPFLDTAANEIAFVSVIFLMTLFTLIFGELIPKRIAFARPESVALFLADFVTYMTVLAVPFNYLLSVSSNVIMRLCRIPEGPSSKVSADEVKHFLSEGVEAGILGASEGEMLEGVMRLADRPVKTIMTPRTSLFWVDCNDPSEVLQQSIVKCPYALVVVANGSIDDVMGVVFKKDLVSQVLDKNYVGIDIKSLLRQPVMVPEGVNTLGLIEIFRQYPVHCAFILDEYGSLQGLVTLTDIIHGITGHLADTHTENMEPTKCEDGSWILYGDTDVSEIERCLNIPKVELANYHTLGGHLLALFGRIPDVGDKVIIGDWTLEIVEIDSRRIGKVLARADKQ